MWIQHAAFFLKFYSGMKYPKDWKYINMTIAEKSTCVQSDILNQFCHGMAGTKPNLQHLCWPFVLHLEFQKASSDAHSVSLHS